MNGKMDCKNVRLTKFKTNVNNNNDNDVDVDVDDDDEHTKQELNKA